MKKDIPMQTLYKIKHKKYLSLCSSSFVRLAVDINESISSGVVISIVH